MEQKDYYSLLGVPEDAEQATIKKAYRKLARRYHPDVSEEPDAEARFKEIAEAWEILGDEEKRAAYDAFRNGEQQRFRQAGGGGGGTGPDVDFGEFFRNIFGEEMGAGFGGGFRSHRQRGEDLHARLPLTLEEAYTGSEQTLSLSVPELTSQGMLQRRDKQLRVKIPAGVTDGQQIRLAGQGGPMPGGEPGDLYVEIQLVPHPDYAVDGRNLTRKVRLAPWEAVLGARLEVPTLGGRVAVKVPAGTRTGQRLRLRGRGLPGNPSGDQFLEFEIVTPPQPTPRERELYEALAAESDFDPRKGEQ